MTGERVIIVSPVFSIIADNPRQSELGSRKTRSGRDMCLHCLRTQGLNIYQIRQKRTREFTFKIIRKVTNMSRSRNRIVTRDAAALELKTGVKTTTNKILNLRYFCPFKCLPVKILHTLFLGICKYAINFIHKELRKEVKKN
jgi:hypothetical protein